MVNQIAELQKKICNLERDIEVILLHSCSASALTLYSSSEHVKTIIQNIDKIRAHEFTVEYAKRFMQAVDKLPIDTESKKRFHAYVNDGVGNKDCTIIEYQNERNR